MAIDTQTHLEHYERINHVTQYIRNHVDEPLNRDQLAGIAGFSVPHFHRIFKAYVGETISQYLRRVRMERAAWKLLKPAVQVVDVAFDSGYETHSAFSRAFKQTFGVSPLEFRELNRSAAAHLLSRRIIHNRKEQEMKPQEVRELPDTKVLYARTSEIFNGPAFKSAPGEAFNRLMGFLDTHDLTKHARQFIAIYPDEPKDGEEVRFDAGVIFADGVEPTASAGLAYQTLKGGRWAIFRHTGPYDRLWQTWDAIYRDWLPGSGEELRNALCFEDYVDDPSEVAPDKLRTDIYVPIG